MTNWTAEVEWHGDPRLGPHHRLLRALDAVLLLVRGLAGQQVSVNRIAATNAYHHESSLSTD